MTSEDGLSRSTKRRAVVVFAIAGLTLVAIGALLFYLGATFEEPAERLSTRSVPSIAPKALCAGGVAVALAGLWMAVRGATRRR
ncbi:MAG TPA: hypothetical protein VLB44_14540 [Kofleriaceae bacterium]|nr:hypothetical protein [Kofleriaceae bacterium]